jgi:hypothetical protein
MFRDLILKAVKDNLGICSVMDGAGFKMNGYEPKHGVTLYISPPSLSLPPSLLPKSVMLRMSIQHMCKCAFRVLIIYGCCETAESIKGIKLTSNITF